MHFSRYAEKVTMRVRGSDLSRGMSDYLANCIMATPNVEVRFGVEVTALESDKVLREIEITDRHNDSITRAQTNCPFVCIGGAPNAEWAKETAIMRDGAGCLITGPDLLQEGRSPECWPLKRMYFISKLVFPAPLRRVMCAIIRSSASPVKTDGP